MDWIEAVPLPALRVDARGFVAGANRLAGKLFARSAPELVGAAPDPSWPAPAATVPLAEGALLLFSDARVVERLQQQVYHLSRLASAGRLVAVVVHEINNALSGIVGYAQFLLAQPLDGDARRDLERMHEEALRTARVAQNLLRFSRGGRGERSPLALGELLARCAELKRRDLTLRSIALELVVPEGLPPVDGDDALLAQVFVNLISNSQQGISSVRERGRVTVRARTRRRVVVVDVADDGPGIPEELRERIFEPFFTARADGSGTGLGLTLSREIVADHGGELRLLHRRTPGATFRVVLPLSRTAALPSAAQERASGPSPAVVNRRVVIVEDEPALREVIARAFAGNGNHVVTFEQGEDALQWLEREAVDLIVSDLHRPGIDGFRLYEHLSRTRPALLRRILFVTGDALGDETGAFLRKTRIPALRKPLQLEELARAARGVVDQAPPQRDLFGSTAAAEREA